MSDNHNTGAAERTPLTELSEGDLEDFRRRILLAVARTHLARARALGGARPVDAARLAEVVWGGAPCGD